MSAVLIKVLPLKSVFSTINAIAFVIAVVSAVSAVISEVLCTAALSA